MKTCLYTPCYLEGFDALGNNRLERNLRYIKYYLELQNELGFDRLWLADNASSLTLLNRLREHPSQVSVMRFDPHWPRSEGPNPYPYCWRALYFIRDLIDLGYEKIITIDSDCFILSQRLAKYIKQTQSGWVSFWSQKYEFPTAEFHILCLDSFDRFLKFTSVPIEEHFGKLMERELPFSRIEYRFNCDRWGETDEPVTRKMDAYFQAKLTRALQFEKPL